MLETDEGNSTAAGHELSSVRRSDADHEDNIDIRVYPQESGTPLLSVARERHHVGAFQHRAKVGSVGKYCGAYDLVEEGTIGVDDVVVPVWFENPAVKGEVLSVSSEIIGVIEDGEEVWDQIDQHQDLSAGGRALDQSLPDAAR